MHGACLGIQSKKEIPPPYRCDLCAQLSDQELELMQQRAASRACAAAAAAAAAAASAASPQRPLQQYQEPSARSHSLPELPTQVLLPQNFRSIVLC
jgi:hypothetical protein